MTRWVDRVRTASLPWHALALALVLVALLAVVDPRWSYSADEGASIIQARSLAGGDGWIVDHPFPEADPTGDRYPLELSSWGERGVAPYAKHPLYPVLLAGADRVGGIVGMLLLSVAGTVGAAAGAALLARRVRPGTERATLWTVGLLSPVLFSSFWVIAHSAAAALVALAVLAALRAGDGGGPKWAVLCAVAVALACALRTEATFVALGLGAVGAWEVVRHRSREWALTAALAGGAVLAVRLVEHGLVRRIVGDARPVPTFRTEADRGFLSDRWEAFVQTWLRPGVPDVGAGRTLLLLAVLLAAVAVWQLGRRRPDPALACVAAVGAAGLVVARSVAVTSSTVPGLLAAFPLLWIGLAVGRRAAVPTPAARRLAAVAAIGALAVLATQYRAGGTSEWGGRYFTVLLPLAVPLAVCGLVAVATRVDPGIAKVLGAALVTGSVGLSGLAVREVRSGHDRTEGVLEVVDQAAASLDEPVIVTTVPALPRLAWRHFDEQRWLLIQPDDERVLADLEAAGVDRFVLVSFDLDDTLRDLGGPTVVPGAPRSAVSVVVESGSGANMRSQVVGGR